MATRSETETTTRRASEHKNPTGRADAGSSDLNSAFPKLANAEAASANLFQFWRQAMAANEELMRFGIQRAHRYQHFFHEMSACTTPADAMRISSEAAQCCVDDYLAQAQKLGARDTHAAALVNLFTPPTLHTK